MRHISQIASGGPTDATSLSLLERVKANDAGAWQRLVHLYAPLVFSWCQRSGMSHEDSSDAIQEIFAAVAANIAQFRRDRPGGTFRGWLRVIARNAIRLHFRRQAGRAQAVGGSTAQARIQELPDEQDADALDPSEDHQDQTALFRRGLELIRGEFEEHTWQAFWLSAVEERSAAEIGSQLHMTAAAVRNAKYKVLHRLRDELGDVLE